MSIGDLVQEIKNPSVAQLMAAYPTMDALRNAVKMGKVARTTEVGAVADIYNRVILDAMTKQAQTNNTVMDEMLASGSAPAGLPAVPVREDMFKETMTGASGGLVAMAGGGDVQRFQGQGESFVKGPTFSDYLKKRQDLEKILVDQYGYSPNEVVLMSDKTKEMILSGKSMTKLPARLGGDELDAEAQAGYGQSSSLDPEVQAAINYTPPQTKVRAPTFSVPAAPADRKMSDFEEQAREAFAGIKKPESLTYEGVMEERNKRLAALGIDPKFFTTEAGKIEQEIEGLGKSRSEAANMRLLEAGLNILGGTSPYAFENIGKGASAALKGFSEDVKDLNKQKRELKNAQRQLRMAQNELDTKGSDAAAAKVEARKDQILNLENQIEQNVVNLTGTLKTAAENKDWKKYSTDVQVGLAQAQMNFKAYLAELEINKPTEIRKSIDVYVDRVSKENKFTPEQTESLRTALLGQELGIRLKGKGGEKGALTEKQQFDINNKAIEYADAKLQENPNFEKLMKAANKGDQKAVAEINRLRQTHIDQFKRERMPSGRASGSGGAEFVGFE